MFTVSHIADSQQFVTNTLTNGLIYRHNPLMPRPTIIIAGEGTWLRN